MKISEGMRIATKGKRQVRDMWGEGKDGVCALGSLMYFGSDIRKQFPAIDDRDPDTGILIKQAIIFRNDNGETFSQIIDWLESIGQ